MEGSALASQLLPPCPDGLGQSVQLSAEQRDGCPGQSVRPHCLLCPDKLKRDVGVAEIATRGNTMRLVSQVPLLVLSHEMVASVTKPGSIIMETTQSFFLMAQPSEPWKTRYEQYT
jgi:hypothetical protein